MVRPIFEENYANWNQENASFQQTYQNSFVKRIKLALGCHKNVKLDHYQKLNEFAQKASEAYSLNELYKKYDKLKFKDFQDPKYLFLKEVIKCHFQRIEECKDSKGFMWKVSNPQTNVTHYVVGTSHAATKQMINHPQLKEIIQNSKIIFTELEANKLIFIARKIERFMAKSKLKYAIDDEMQATALKQKKVVRGLETVREQLKTPNRSPITSQISGIFHVITETFFSSRITNHIAAQLWQNGDDAEVESIVLNAPSYSLKDRNDRWLYQLQVKDSKEHSYKGILALLQKTEQPACIAVGAAHCFGKAGIIPVLQANNFTVERIL